MLDIERPVFGDNPSIASWRDRLTECFTRAADGRAASLRLLLVLSDGTRDAVSVIRLANALARHCRVFLVNARPTSVDAEVPRLIAPEVVLLEGSLGPVPWYPLPEPDVTPSGGPALRLTVISELIRFFDIELLISNGCEADSLAFFLSEQLGRDWFIQIDGAHREALERAERGDTDQLSALTAAMRGATGICSALPGDLDRLHRLGLTLPPSRLVLPTRVFQDSLGRREPRTRETPSGQGDHEFRFLLGCRDPLDPLYQDARNAASALNALPAEERDRRHARLITLDSVERDAGAGGGGEDAARPGPAHSGAWDAALAASNMAVIACSTPTPECVAAIFDCLAHGLPVIVSDSSIMADIVQTEHGPAGLLRVGRCACHRHQWTVGACHARRDDPAGAVHPPARQRAGPVDARRLRRCRRAVLCPAPRRGKISPPSLPRFGHTPPPDVSTALDPERSARERADSRETSRQTEPSGWSTSWRRIVPRRRSYGANATTRWSASRQ